MFRKSITLAAAFLVTAAAADAQRNVASQSRLSSTDKTLWLVPDMVQVGTILQADPDSWTRGGDGTVSVYSNALVGKIPVGPGPQGTETLTFSSNFDLATILPFLRLFSAAFQRSHTVVLKSESTSVDQIPEVAAAQSVLQDFDRSTKNTVDRNAFGYIRAGAAAASERPERAAYWIVTKVYRAGSLTWSDDRRHQIALGGSCEGGLVDATLPEPQAADPTPQPAATPLPPSSTLATPNSGPAPVPAGNAAARASAALSINAQQRGAASGSLNVNVGTPQATSSGSNTMAAAAPNASTPVVAMTAPSCTIAKLSTGSARGRVGSTKNAIVFIQMKPIFRNPGRGTLYISRSAQLAPTVISRS